MVVSVSGPTVKLEIPTLSKLLEPGPDTIRFEATPVSNVIGAVRLPKVAFVPPILSTLLLPFADDTRFVITHMIFAPFNPVNDAPLMAGRAPVRFADCTFVSLPAS